MERWQTPDRWIRIHRMWNSLIAQQRIRGAVEGASAYFCEATRWKAWSIMGESGPSRSAMEFNYLYC